MGRLAGEGPVWYVRDSMGVETKLPGRMSACLGSGAAGPHGAQEACVGGVKRESPGKGLGADLWGREGS